MKSNLFKCPKCNTKDNDGNFTKTENVTYNKHLKCNMFTPGWNVTFRQKLTYGWNCKN